MNQAGELGNPLGHEPEKVVPLDQWERIAAVVRAVHDYLNDDGEIGHFGYVDRAHRALTPDDIEAVGSSRRSERVLDECPTCGGTNTYDSPADCRTCYGNGGPPDDIEAVQPCDRCSVRTVVWFSAGAASAVATKLVLLHDPDATIVYVNPGSEHPDNERFLTDCEKWFERDVVRLRSEKYRDTWQVWTERRFIVGPAGALCTTELKKKVRQQFQRPDDRQVFGYTIDERHRAERFADQNPEVDLWCPLIDEWLTKDDCLAMVDRAGIELPAMYKLGYRNNNCIGCPKGGIGYWNKIRRDFPDTFHRMAVLERELDASCLRDEQGSVWLDELDPARGNHADEPNFECSLLCHFVEQRWTP